MCQTNYTECQRERWIQQILHKPLLSTAIPLKSIITLKACRVLCWVMQWHPTQGSACPPSYCSSSCSQQAASTLRQTLPSFSHFGKHSPRQQHAEKSSLLSTELGAAIGANKPGSRLKAGCETFELKTI